MKLKFLAPLLLVFAAACAPRHEPAPISCAGSIPLVSANYVEPAPKAVAPATVKKATYRKKRVSTARRSPRKAVAAKRAPARRPARRVQQANVVTPPIPLPMTPVEPYADTGPTFVVTPPLQ